MKKTLGGNRLGAENIMPKVDLDTPGRSNQDLSRINRFGATPGILYPVLIEEVQAHDTAHIATRGLIKTIPTEGPLFGSFKSQLDLFFVPLRLYTQELHNNSLEFDPNEVHWPQIQMTMPSEYIGGESETKIPLTNFSYIRISTGAITSIDTTDGYEAIQSEPLQITSNYRFRWTANNRIYENPECEFQLLISTDNGNTKTWTNVTTLGLTGPIITEPAPGYMWAEWTAINIPGTTYYGARAILSIGAEQQVGFEGVELLRRQVNPSQLMHFLGYSGAGHQYPNKWVTITDERNAIGVLGYYDIFKNYYANTQEEDAYYVGDEIIDQSGTTILSKFPLKNIDLMRKIRISKPSNEQEALSTQSISPYNAAAITTRPMRGLVVKTYMADRFNAFLSTKTVDAISNRTLIAIENNTFSLDALRLANKVNEMLQKTLVSGGTWTDWLQVQFGKSVRMQTEIPIWIGSTHGEVVFEDVTSTAATETQEGTQPLGTLAGKGHGSWNKSRFTQNIDEPGVIMGIFSLTPRVDYSMGNRAYTRRKTLGDSHIPKLDAIGFQDLITDELAAFDNQWDDQMNVKYRAIAKQPAWTEYMTATNETHGALAAGGVYSWMALNRIYHTENISGNPALSKNTLGDGTSYIDPQIYNQVFADTALTAENFWVQLAFNFRVKRAISKRVMPKL